MAGKSVLVIDDDDKIRDLLKLVLESAGYDVAVARDGHEAIRQLNDEDEPALIVLDLMMPEMSGFQLAQRLLELGVRPKVPVLVLTAASQAWLKADWISAEGVVEKPFQIPVLLEEVARLATV